MVAKNVVTVGRCMTKSVVTLPKDAKVTSAIRLMAERSISCIVVVNKTNKPIGIITERDLVKRVLFANIFPKETKMEQVMSSPVITTSKNTNIFEAITKMQKNKIRRLVVTDSKGKLIGIVTQTDLFKGVILLGS